MFRAVHCPSEPQDAGLGVFGKNSNQDVAALYAKPQKSVKQDGRQETTDMKPDSAG